MAVILFGERNNKHFDRHDYGFLSPWC